MVKRTVRSEDKEPEQITFELPSEKEHLFHVLDVIPQDDPNIVLVKLEVVGGDEAGRSTLNRLSLDDNWKGFFATRLFLKVIGEQYKGEQFEIDTDNWIGKQFYATIVHNEYKGKTYANINEYNYEKMIDQPNTTVTKVSSDDAEVAWDDES